MGVKRGANTRLWLHNVPDTILPQSFTHLPPRPCCSCCVHVPERLAAENGLFGRSFFVCCLLRRRYGVCCNRGGLEGCGGTGRMHVSALGTWDAVYSWKVLSIFSISRMNWSIWTALFSSSFFLAFFPACRLKYLKLQNIGLLKCMATPFSPRAKLTLSQWRSGSNRYDSTIGCNAHAFLVLQTTAFNI